MWAHVVPRWQVRKVQDSKNSASQLVKALWASQTILLACSMKSCCLRFGKRAKKVGRSEVVVNFRDEVKHVNFWNTCTINHHCWTPELRLTDRSFHHFPMAPTYPQATWHAVFPRRSFSPSGSSSTFFGFPVVAVAFWAVVLANHQGGDADVFADLPNREICWEPWLSWEGFEMTNSWRHYLEGCWILILLKTDCFLLRGFMAQHPSNKGPFIQQPASGTWLFVLAFVPHHDVGAATKGPWSLLVLK